jgi:hypothetical protein
VDHFRLVRQLRCTLIARDRDFLDDRPPRTSSDVLGLTSPNEADLSKMLTRLDMEALRI